MARTARTTKALIAALGAPRSTVYRLVKLPDCPRRKDGSYDVAKVRAWMDDRRVRRAEKAAAARHETDPSEPAEPAPPEQEADASGAPRWADVRTRKAMVETQRALLELQIKRRETIPRSEVATLLASRMSTLRRRLQSAARAIGRKCGEELDADAMAVEDIARDLLLQVLREIYGKVPSDIEVA